MTYRQAPNVRHAEIHAGDTLQRIALRELGDASRWIEIAVLNGLRPPYLVPIDSFGDGVLRYGDLIKIPAPGASIAADTDPDATFGRDLSVRQGRLGATPTGDLLLVSGLANLKQAVSIRVLVEKRELGFHPDFGCWIRTLLGAIGGPRSTRLAAFYVRSALLEEPRILTVQSCTAEARGDSITVRAVVTPVSGISAEIAIEV